MLSGMSSLAQMEDNLSYMKHFTTLDEGQMQTIEEAQKVLKGIQLIPCTTCNYCAKVCPMNIGISGSFTAMNILTLFRNQEGAAHQEQWLVTGHGKKRAEACIKCGKCEQVCPQHILIREELVKVSKAFA